LSPIDKIPKIHGFGVNSWIQITVIPTLYHRVPVDGTPIFSLGKPSLMAGQSNGEPEPRYKLKL